MKINLDLFWEGVAFVFCFFFNVLLPVFECLFAVLDRFSVLVAFFSWFYGFPHQVIASFRLPRNTKHQEGESQGQQQKT